MTHNEQAEQAANDWIKGQQGTRPDHYSFKQGYLAALEKSTRSNNSSTPTGLGDAEWQCLNVHDGEPRCAVQCEYCKRAKVE